MHTAYNPKYIKALEKIAYPFGFQQQNVTVGVSYPPPSVSDVLSAINQAQVHGIGTPQQRTDAFGRIVNSGLEVSSPASAALKLIGGGVLGRSVAGMITNNPFLKGVGTGIGVLASMPRY